MYTKEQLDYLRAHNSWHFEVLAWAFNNEFGTTKTVGQLKSAYSNHKIKRVRRPLPPRLLLLSKKQVTFLKEKYKTLSRADVTSALNMEFGTSFTENQIRCFLRNHKIKSGRTGCFTKGSEPWNKDTRGICKANTGSFSKGSVPANKRPIGVERVCTKDGYVLINVPEQNPYTGAQTRFKAKHIVIWEAENGPVPDGHILRFKDGDKTNCAIENLECITMAEHLYLNRYGYNELNDNLKPTLRIMAKVVVKAGALQK